MNCYTYRERSIGKQLAKLCPRLALKNGGRARHCDQASQTQENHLILRARAYPGFFEIRPGFLHAGSLLHRGHLLLRGGGNIIRCIALQYRSIERAQIAIKT